MTVCFVGMYMRARHFASRTWHQGRRAGNSRGGKSMKLCMYLRLNVFYCFIVLCACISYMIYCCIYIFTSCVYSKKTLDDQIIRWCFFHFQLATHRKDTSLFDPAYHQGKEFHKSTPWHLAVHVTGNLASRGCKQSVKSTSCFMAYWHFVADGK